MVQKLEIFLSATPSQRFSSKFLSLEFIKGIRCNTGASIDRPIEDLLFEFQQSISPIPLWIDLKCRELRIIQDAKIPEEPLILNHKIHVHTPTAMYYNEGKKFLVIDRVEDGNKLFIRKPKKMVEIQPISFGKGASINIPDDSLEIQDYLTDNDRNYIAAAKELNIHNYFLSFVESASDINALLELDPDANICAKIESKKGIDFIKNDFDPFKGKIRLIAARGDLYIELNLPHEILSAMKELIRVDPSAIGASRILESFMDHNDIPKCADICDLGYLIELGYSGFLLGDDLCENEDALSSALGLFDALSP
jgi:Pyruvate kinase, barrel domain